MCGIVGCVGKIFKAEEDAFLTLLELDTIRGPHSTGMLSVISGDPKWSYLKVVGTPWDLYEAKGFKELKSRFHRALLGHNRWATRGEVTSENAHPFVHGDYVGVHNGTLRSGSGLEDFGKFEVDSEAIFYNMSKEGPEETIKKLNGAFALVWYNIKDNTIQIVRNSERPLWICSSEDKKTHFWASESWMLNIALGRAGIKHDTIVEVPIGTLVTIDVSQNPQLNPAVPHLKKVDLYEPPSRYSYVHTESTKDNRGVRDLSMVRKLKSYVKKFVILSVVGERNHKGSDYIDCLVEDDLDIHVRIFIGPRTNLSKKLLRSQLFFKAEVKGFTCSPEYGNYLIIDHRSVQEVYFDGTPVSGEKKTIPVNNSAVTAEEWYELTSGGCSWCDSLPRIQQANEVTWISKNQFLCPECSKNPEVLSAAM